MHGPHCELARRALAIEESICEFDCIQWKEEVIPHGWSTVEFRAGMALGTYIKSGHGAIVQTNVGSGRVFSFGFQYGYAYFAPHDANRTAAVRPQRNAPGGCF